MVRELYDGETYQVWISTHAAALTSTSLSLIGEFYVFYKTYKLARTRKLDLSHKLPAAISFCDFLFNFHHGIDHLYSLVNHRVADGALCTWLGWGSLVGLEATALWSLILAAYMSSLVVFGLRLGFDHCIWALALFGWGLPIIANTIAAAFGEIGDAGMFCMVNGPVTAVIMKPGLFLTVFFFIALCYIAIGMKLGWHVYHHCRTLSSTQGSDTNDFRNGFRASISHRAQRVGLHLFGFTIVYMLQFLPVCIMVFTIVSGNKPGHVLNIFDKVLANGNGWMNAIAYRHFLRTSRHTVPSTIHTTETGKETAYEMGYPENSSMCKGQIEVTVSRHIILDLPDKGEKEDPQTPK